MREMQAVQAITDMNSSVVEQVGSIDTYFPRIYSSMPVGGKMRKVLKSLFPRYFFARFVWQHAYRYITSRSNVLGVIQFGDFPAIVAEEVIGELKSWSISTETEIFDPTLELSSGQRVFIKNGPFKGMEAEFLSHLSDQKRVALLLDHLQSQAKLIVDRTYLKLVS